MLSIQEAPHNYSLFASHSSHELDLSFFAHLSLLWKEFGLIRVGISVDLCWCWHRCSLVRESATTLLGMLAIGMQISNDTSQIGRLGVYDLRVRGSRNLGVCREAFWLVYVAPDISPWLRHLFITTLYPLAIMCLPYE